MKTGKYEGHTPGPWHYDAIDNDNQWVIDAAGNYLLQVITHDDEGRAVPADIGERNARLAADAPTLLAQRDALAEALRAVLPMAENDAASLCEWAEKHDDDDEIESAANMCRAIEQARAALAALEE